jgi:hypothetical protein
MKATETKYKNFVERGDVIIPPLICSVAKEKDFVTKPKTNGGKIQGSKK